MDIFDSVKEAAVAITAVLGAVGVIWRKVLKPVVEAAKQMSTVLERFPTHEEKLDELLGGQESFRGQIHETTERLNEGEVRFQGIDQRFDGVDGKLDAVLAQIVNGNPDVTLVDRINACNQRIDDHSRDDMENFRGLGEWTKNFRGFVPFSPAEPEQRT